MIQRKVDIMLRYFVSKLLISVVLLLGVLTLAFFMLRMTGDPVALMMSRDASPEEMERQRQRIILKGEPPSPANPQTGCVFHPRCPIAEEICKMEAPEFGEIQPGHFAACHLAHTQIDHKIVKDAPIYQQ